MTAIELDDVSRAFETPEGRSYSALERISLAVSAGSFAAIVGPSGCGKSTLLNLVAGLLRATSGRVRILGQTLEGLNRQATYMFQQDALLPWKDVRENVALGLTLAGVSRAAAQRRADEWLARVGLTAFARHFPSQLSGGMRKRVAMAQNWIIERDILLMDEPFSALDIHTRQRMESELLALWEGGTDRSLGRIRHARSRRGHRARRRGDRAVGRPGQSHRVAAPRDARPAARPARSAHAPGVRRSLSIGMGRSAAGSDQEPA